jgi:hypothetical protein
MALGLGFMSGRFRAGEVRNEEGLLAKAGRSLPLGSARTFSGLRRAVLTGGGCLETVDFALPNLGCRHPQFSARGAYCLSGLEHCRSRMVVVQNGFDCVCCAAALGLVSLVLDGA